MPMVATFGRETTTQGKVYPRGAKVPGDLFSPARLLLLRNQRVIVEIEHERGAQYPEPQDVPTVAPAPPVVDRATARVAAARAELAAATVALNTLLGVDPETEADGDAADREADGARVPAFLN